ncbi:MAG: AzlC family ABC transporter permease [Acidimicrobiia bacterium]
MSDTSSGLRTADILALGAASLAVGVTVSAVMIDIGTPSAVVMVATVTAFSGSGELAYAAVILSGGSTAAAMVSALLVSSRFGLLAMSIANRWPMSVWERIAAMQISGEPAVAAAITARDPAVARKLYWQVALSMAVGWVVGSAIGVALGNVIGDTKAIGLDAVFPAVLLGTVAAALRSRDSAVAAILGGVVAVVLVPIAPAGIPFLVAALAALVGARVRPGPLRRRPQPGVGGGGPR